MRSYCIALLGLIVCGSSLTPAAAQETIFHLPVSRERLAGRYFEVGNYKAALGIYEELLKSSNVQSIHVLRAARCYFKMKRYDEALETYGRVTNLSDADLRIKAECYASLGDFKSAAGTYRDYLRRNPEDTLILKKQWRFANAHYLYEDSLQIAISALGTNSQASDGFAVPVENGVYFVSNRGELELIKRSDVLLDAPFYRLYFAPLISDSLTLGARIFGKPQVVEKRLVKFHVGPFSLFDRGRQVVFTANGANGKLKLMQAVVVDGHWSELKSLPFNNQASSFSDPAIDATGVSMVFASDKDGGFGGWDLYRTELKDGHWSNPVNLGPVINTRYDERYPSFHGQFLYFSSDGHPGLGGLDIFRFDLNNSSVEPQNSGYPVNSTLDDFAFLLDSSGVHGYLTSNRQNGGFDDDIYEFDIDLQSYPLTISGIVKIKEHSWNDLSELQVLTGARLIVYDHIRNVKVDETTSYSNGKFELVIPYFSKYKVRIVLPDNEESMISLELPRNKVVTGDREMVVVKDVFK